MKGSPEKLFQDILRRLQALFRLQSAAEDATTKAVLADTRTPTADGKTMRSGIATDWKPSPRGFSLIELLVVVAIIGLLLAMLLPAIQNVREAARRTQCANRLHQMGLALHNYHNTLGRFPAGIIEENGLLWSGSLLPFLEQQNVVESMRPDMDWTDPANAAALQIIFPMYRCPSAAAPLRQDHGVPDRVPATYLAVASGTLGRESGTPPTLYDAEQDGLFFRDSGTKFRDVRDGTSYTAAIGETLVDVTITAPDHFGIPQLLDHWCVGTSTFSANEVSEAIGSTAVPVGVADSHDPRIFIEDKELSYSSRHPGGAQMLFIDGRMQLITDSIDRQIWSAVGTRNGLEVVHEL